MNVFIFLGPTLSTADARQYLEATYLPPVQQGDIIRLLDRTPHVIGIVDGLFELVPSVWHKEILLALSKGVYVYGAASMGALRAAELARFGMVGIGQIYESYVSGEIEDDDEVVVRHGDKESGFIRVSEAMVDIRDTFHQATRCGIVSAETTDLLIHLAKSLPYHERHYSTIFNIARERLGHYEGANALSAFVKSKRATLKQRDTIALLERIRSLVKSSPPPFEASYHVEYTIFLDTLIKQARTAVTTDANAGRSVAAP
jgi:hypothetical protein